MCKFITPDDYRNDGSSQVPPSLGKGSFPPLREAEIDWLRDRLVHIDVQLENSWPSDKSPAPDGADVGFWQRIEVVEQLEHYGQDVEALEADIREMYMPHILPETPGAGPEFGATPECPGEWDGYGGGKESEMDAWPDDGDPYGTAEYLISWEFPRLCRGGSRSLTFTGIYLDSGFLRG